MPNLKVVCFILLILVIFSSSCTYQNTAAQEKLTNKPAANYVEAATNSMTNKTAANAVKEVQTPLLDYRRWNSKEQCKTSADKDLCFAIAKDQGLDDAELSESFELVFAKTEVDLNNDGENEVVAWVPARPLGGTSGYPIIIFSKINNKHKRIWSIDQAWTPIIALDSKTNGWTDLVMQFGGGGAEWQYFKIAFRKGKYRIAKDEIDDPKGKILIDKDWNQTILGPIPKTEKN